MWMFDDFDEVWLFSYDNEFGRGIFGSRVLFFLMWRIDKKDLVKVKMMVVDNMIWKGYCILVLRCFVW